MTESKGSQPRRRAPGMSPEERRAMIIQTAIPLVTVRRPPEQIAALFIGLLFTQPRTGDVPDLTPRELVEVFLHGAVAGGAE